MKFETRIPEIVAEIPIRTDAVLEKVAELAAERAREKVPVRTGNLRDSIHVEETGEHQFTVIAGNNTAFYGHIVEHGSVVAPAHPFVTPAAEEVRGLIDGIGRIAFRGL